MSGIVLAGLVTCSLVQPFKEPARAVSTGQADSTHASSQAEKSTWQRIMDDPLDFLTLGLVLLNGALVGVMVWQSRTLGRQVAKTDEIARRQLRAYVGAREGGIFPGLMAGGPLKFVPTLKNSGQTPAYDLKWAAAAKHLPFPSASVDTLPLKALNVFSAGVLGPGQELPLNLFSDRVEPTRFAEQSFKFYVFGTAWYRDAFGDRQRSEFCYWINPGGGTPEVPHLWTLMHYHNEAT